MGKSQETDQHIGACALCDQENTVLKESHIIPKFVFQWLKDTSPTPYLRSSDNVNVRKQDGPKEYLLCGACEEYLSAMETELAEKLFKKIANYRTQAEEIVVTSAIRTGVLSIFWRALLTSLNQNSGHTEEDKVVIRNFLSSAKAQIKQGSVTTSIYITPFYGQPPFYDLPIEITYHLDRMTGSCNIRFLDNPHRYYAVCKLPFMFFYIISSGWEKEIDPNAKLCDSVRLSEIQRIPSFLRKYIYLLVQQFETLNNSMSSESREQITRDVNKSTRQTGAHKSMIRSKTKKP